MKFLHFQFSQHIHTHTHISLKSLHNSSKAFALRGFYSARADNKGALKRSLNSYIITRKTRADTVYQYCPSSSGEKDIYLDGSEEKLFHLPARVKNPIPWVRQELPIHPAMLSRAHKRVYPSPSSLFLSLSPVLIMQVTRARGYAFGALGVCSSRVVAAAASRYSKFQWTSSREAHRDVYYFSRAYRGGYRLSAARAHYTYTMRSPGLIKWSTREMTNLICI